MAILLPEIDENIDKKIVMKEDLENTLKIRDNLKKDETIIKRLKNNDIAHINFLLL